MNCTYRESSSYPYNTGTLKFKPRAWVKHLASSAEDVIRLVEERCDVAGPIPRYVLAQEAKFLWFKKDQERARVNQAYATSRQGTGMS